MSAPPEKDDSAGIRVLGAVVFFGLGLWLGALTFVLLHQRFHDYYFGSFGFNLNFGVVRLGEPWSSCFLFLCSTLFIWAGVSLLRRRTGRRVGALAGTVALLISLVAFLAGA